MDPPARDRRTAIARRASARALLSLLAVEARARSLQGSAKFLRRPALFALIVDPSGQERAQAVAAVGRHVAMSIHRIDVGEISQGDAHEDNFRRLLDAAQQAGVIVFLDNAHVLFDSPDDEGRGEGRFHSQFLLDALDGVSGVVIAAVRERAEIPGLLLVRARYLIDFTVPTDQMRLNLTPEGE